MDSKHYRPLLVMVILHFIAMYFLMYAMVDTFSNVFTNFNQFYMAAIMTTPMIIIELVLMWSMYHNRKWNAAILAISTIAFIVFFVFIRQQAAISDEQFLKSMIPHHAGAILMCNEASLQDPEILELCENIKLSQQSEIDQMKRILNRLE